MPGVSTYQRSGNSFIDAVIGGQKWSSASFTYSFPASTDAYGSKYGFGELTSGFAGMSSSQQQAVRSVLGQYQSIAQVTFTETSGGSADFRYGRTGATSTAWAYTPQTALEGGDVWISNSLSQFNTPKLGGYAYLILLHETGHAMGFKEAFEVDGDFKAMPVAHDSLEYTVMSYSSYVGASTKNGYANGTWDYPQSLMLDDVRALQFLYGANFANAGKSITYSWNPNTGEMSINGVGQGEPGGNRIFQTVWTGGAKATYDFSAYAESVNIDLRPGEWSTTSRDQLARLGGVEHLAAGNIANAYLVTQGDLNNLVSNVIGGAGNDRLLGNDADNALTGGKGDDRIDGGAGVDTAVYAGRSSNYSVVHDAAGSWTLTASGDAKAEGTDTLWNVEYLQFADGRLTVEEFGAITRKAAQIEAPALPPAADVSIPTTTAATGETAPLVAPETPPATVAVPEFVIPADAVVPTTDIAIPVAPPVTPEITLPVDPVVTQYVDTPIGGMSADDVDFIGLLSQMYGGYYGAL